MLFRSGTRSTDMNSRNEKQSAVDFVERVRVNQRKVGSNRDIVGVALEGLRRNAQPETRSGEVQTMRMKFKLFLVLVTIQIGCTGMPLFAHPNFPAKASRNAPTEIHGLRHGVPQFLRQFEDPLLDRLMTEAISSTKHPAILAFRIREARAMHRGYELSPFPSTTNPTRIAELQLITARREAAPYQ